MTKSWIVSLEWPADKVAINICAMNIVLASYEIETRMHELGYKHFRMEDVTRCVIMVERSEE